MRKSLTINGQEIGIEGLAIFLVVAYETIALAVNFILGRKVLRPITDILGPATHSRIGKFFVWLFLGYCWDHFYKNGENYLKNKQ